MNITKEQIEAAEQGNPVDIQIDDVEFVLIRKDIYEKGRKIVLDDSEWTVSEMRAMASRAFDEGDTAGPIE